MSNTEKPDVATVDGSEVDSRLIFADKAEKLLRAILVALGYENAGALRGADLIAGITAWITLFVTMKREPNGSYASFWARAFLDVCKDLPVDDAAECADKMTNHFAKRYPPMLDDVAIDEDSRDTQSDLQSAMVELDKQTQLVWQLESERNALLKANEHHASELATCRIQLSRQTSIASSLKNECDNWMNKANELRTRVDAVDAIIAERDSMKAQLGAFRGNMRGALIPRDKPASIEPGQQWAMIGTVIEYGNSETVATMQDGEWFNRNKMLDSEKWIYLGTDKV